MGKEKKSYYYAVQSGRNTGVYSSWGQCQDNVKGYSGAVFKKFDTEAEAREFANESRESAHHHAPPSGRPSTDLSCGIMSIARDSSEEHTRITPKSKRKYSEDECDRGYNKQARYESDSSRYSRKDTSTTIVYTDGASSNNGKTYASAGYGVYWGDNDKRNASEKLSGNLQTNQRAEASAVNHAIAQDIDGTSTLNIHTDSQYVINAATSWSKKWIKNDWKSTNGKPVQNKDLFEKMLYLMDKRKGEVKFTYVPGHSGVEGNEKADELAVAGARK